MNLHDSVFVFIALVIILATYQIQISSNKIPSGLAIATLSLSILIHIIGITLRSYRTLITQLLFLIISFSLTLISVLRGWDVQSQYLIWGLSILPSFLVQLTGLMAINIADKIP